MEPPVADYTRFLPYYNPCVKTSDFTLDNIRCRNQQLIDKILTAIFVKFVILAISESLVTAYRKIART